MNNWNLEYFAPHELRCKGSGGLKLAPGFGERIDELRRQWGKPLRVNSACRSKAHNASVPGHPRSLHVFDDPYWPTGGCCAIDVRETSESFRKLAFDMGFSVGIAARYTHLDTRTEVLGFPKIRFRY